MASGEGTTRPLPDPMDGPPQDAANHWSVAPEPPVALSVMVPESSEQKLSRVLVADAGATGETERVPGSPIEKSEAPHVLVDLTK